MADPYKILKVKREASEKDIKSAYHELAREHHPDMGKDDSKFSIIYNAYKLLSNPETRKQYDEGKIFLDDKMNDCEKMIRQTLADLFIQYISQHTNRIDIVDVFAVIRKHLQQNLKQLTDNAKMTDRLIERLQQAKQRLKKDSGNFFTEVLDNAIEHAELKKANCVKQATFIQQVIVYLADYEWTVDVSSTASISPFVTIGSF